jgi:AraC-like DNA-binding protein
MPDRIFGAEWEKDATGFPSLRLAFEITGKHVFLCTRIKHPEWVLDYEYATYGHYRVGSEKAHWLRRLPGTAHLYPPNTVFWEDTRQEKGFRHSAWMHILGAERAGLGTLVDDQSGYARFIDASGRLGALMHAAAEAGGSGEDGIWKAQAALFGTIDLLRQSVRVEAETFRVPSDSGKDAEPGFVRQVVEHLNAGIGGKVTLAGIAARMNVSLSTLCHRYRRESGESPLATFARLRINHAKVLLAKGYPSKAVADQLGFVDPFHFSKAFKRMEGMTPREFRKQVR